MSCLVGIRKDKKHLWYYMLAGRRQEGCIACSTMLLQSCFSFGPEFYNQANLEHFLGKCVTHIIPPLSS